MTDTDMIIVVLTNGLPTVVDDYAKGRYSPYSDFDLGGTIDVERLSYTFEDGVTKTVVRRKMFTKDPYDFVILQDMTTDLCFAYFQGIVKTYHGLNNGFGEIVLASTQENARFDRYDRYYDDTYNDHAETMITLWLALVNVQIIVARYFKWWKYWIYVHFFVGSTMAFLTVLSVVTVYEFSANVDITYTADTRYHSSIGFFVCSLVIFQVVLGIVSRISIIYGKSMAENIIVRRWMGTDSCQRIMGTELAR